MSEYKVLFHKKSKQTPGAYVRAGSGWGGTCSWKALGFRCKSQQPQIQTPFGFSEAFGTSHAPALKCEYDQETHFTSECLLLCGFCSLLVCFYWSETMTTVIETSDFPGLAAAAFPAAAAAICCSTRVASRALTPKNKEISTIGSGKRTNVILPVS